jgi:exodeoxyribonuclease VII small subunit
MSVYTKFQEVLMAKRKLTFDNAIEELEELVNEINNNDLPLEETVALYKKGIELSIYCNQSINTIEQQVQILVGNSKDSFALEPFDSIVDKE